MGGNVTAIMKNGEQTRATKIPIAQIGVANFRKKMIEVFTELDKLFKKKHGEPLWGDTKLISSGYVFNGSTSFIMDPNLKPKDVELVKPEAGDIDIMISTSRSEQLYELLVTLEKKEFLPGVKYKGSNRTSVDKLGNQINSVFEVKFGDVISFAQVDFESAPFSGGKPSEWARFSHSSTFRDAESGFKAVAHKLLLRALVGGGSARQDILIATPASTPDNLKFKTQRGNVLSVANMLKFSVDRGVRIAYEPMLDNNNKPMFKDGKQILKEIPTNKSDYKTELKSIYTLIFAEKDPQEKDLKEMWSFIGLIGLMKRYMSKDNIERTNVRFANLFWGRGIDAGQELERDDPESDLKIKLQPYQYFVAQTGSKDLSKDLIDVYYKTYGNRGN